MPIIYSKKIFYGWYIVAGSIAMNFILTVFFGLGFNVFFLPILHEFGWSRAITSGAFSLRAVESGLMAPVIGFLVDKWGPRVIILWGVVFSGLGMVLMGYIDSLMGFYIAFLVASLGNTGASHGVSWVTAVANWFDRLRGRALGIAMMGPVLGGPLLATVAIVEGLIGWRVASIILGILLIILGIPLAMLVRSKPGDYGYLPDGDTAPMSTNGEAQHAITNNTKDTEGYTVNEALHTKNFWVMVTIYTLMFVGISGLMVHLIPMLEDLDYTSAQSASILGMMFFLSGIGRLGSGILVDIIAYKYVLLLLIACQLTGLTLLLSVGSDQYWLVMLFALVFGIGFGGTIPLRPYLVMNMFGAKAFGTLQGLVQVGAMGAGVVGPVAYGWMFDSLGSYDIAIYGTLSTILCAIPLTFMLSSKNSVPANTM